MSISRRLPTPLEAVNALSEKTLTVGDIVVSPVWTFDPTEPATAALVSMKTMNYDVAASVLRHYGSSCISPGC
jgi:hypothetical protein